MSIEIVGVWEEPKFNQSRALLMTLLFIPGIKGGEMLKFLRPIRMSLLTASGKPAISPHIETCLSAEIHALTTILMRRKAEG